MFSASKAAQLAAFFVGQQGGTMPVLKLMKLMYLADRESMHVHGEPISYDYMVSMPHGPVLSRVYDLASGSASPEAAANWEEWVSDKENHCVSLARAFTRDDLDQLSDADIAIADAVWQRFGHMGRWQIRDWTHDNCPEWKDPRGSSMPIRDEDLLRVLGKSEAAAQELALRIQRERELDALFASA